MGATVLMIKSAFGLGVLSIPFVFQAVGIVPGIILIIVVELIVTWSAFVLGSFKLNHRECYSMADVGRILAGRWGEEFFTLAVCICMLFFSASGMVGVTTAFNAVTTHATCTAVWMVVVFVVSFGFASIRTLGKVTWLAWPAFFSILSAGECHCHRPVHCDPRWIRPRPSPRRSGGTGALPCPPCPPWNSLTPVLVMTIAVGVQDRPNDAPQAPLPWEKDFKIVNKTDFAGGISAVATILFAAAGTPTYFGIISEMRQPRLYHRAMLINQTFVTTVYIVIGSVVYWYCGQYVSQPSLGSAGHVMKKICYGLSIPGLFFSVILWVHIPAKFIFVRILRGSDHLTKNSVTHWATWLVASFACTTIAYIIGSAIPILNSIISLVGALIAPTLCITPFGAMWLHDNVKGRDWRSLSTWKKAQTFWAIFIILVGVFITVAGTYGAVVTIIQQPGEGSPWSCADNSNSV
jgi:amino acid permease